MREFGMNNRGTVKAFIGFQILSGAAIFTASAFQALGDAWKQAQKKRRKRKVAKGD